MQKNRRLWVNVFAFLMVALLTGCFRGAPKIPLQPFLTLIAPYPGATDVHPNYLSLFWEVDFREAEVPQDEEMLASRETPSIWYLVSLAKGNEDFGEPEWFQGGKNAFFQLDREALEFETEYRWRIAALFADGQRIVSEEASFTTRPPGLQSLPPPTMIRVKAGGFLMGNTRNDSEGRDNEKPVRTVILHYDYWIGKYEVTFAEYDAFCEDTGRRKPIDQGWGRGTRPVMNVSWWDAIAYCNWLSQRAGLRPAYDNNGNLLDMNGRITRGITTVEGYRLPTEAEWEYAARGGHADIAGGFVPVEANDFKYAGSHNINEVAWYEGNTGGEANGKTQPMGQKKPNELGLHDMSGNVAEWCHDWFQMYTPQHETNPIGPSTGHTRIWRGGSWLSRAQNCRVATRSSSLPDVTIRSFLGFRLSRTEATIGNPVDPGEMVRVQAGSFKMGDEVGDLADRTRPVHTVTLTYDYWIGKYEVTFAEYDAFCDETGRSKPFTGWGRDTRPVIRVSWWDAIAYCNWLSGRAMLRPSYDINGNLLDRNGMITTDITQVEGYRLPTEAEWEYAASGGHKVLPIPPRFLYTGSNNIDEVAWYFHTSGGWDGKTQPVGQKKPNELGIYDMSGNVAEWCHDWYGSYTSATKTNPIGPSAGSRRVVRGGGWSDDALYCRVAYRDFSSPGNTDSTLGFRLSRTLY